MASNPVEPRAEPPTPSLAELLFHQAGIAPDLSGEPRIGAAGRIATDAVVFDLMLELGGGFLPVEGLRRFRSDLPADRNRLRLVLAAAWLFHHPYFRQGKRHAEPCRAFLAHGLDELARVVDADLVLTKPERREELIRRALAALGQRPAGETEVQARDRLAGLDSVAQERLLQEARDRLKAEREAEIARKKREEEEAAARYGRE